MRSSSFAVYAKVAAASTARPADRMGPIVPSSSFPGSATLTNRHLLMSAHIGRQMNLPTFSR